MNVKSKSDLKFTELLEKYYMDRITYGEETADSFLRDAIKTDEYTNAFMEMFKEAVRQADFMVENNLTLEDIEDTDGEVH